MWRIIWRKTWETKIIKGCSDVPGERLKFWHWKLWKGWVKTRDILEYRFWKIGAWGKKQAPQPQMIETCSLNDWKKMISNGNGDKKGAAYLGQKSNFKHEPSVELESFFVEKHSCLFQILIWSFLKFKFKLRFEGHTLEQKAEKESPVLQRLDSMRFKKKSLMWQLGTYQLFLENNSLE